MLKNIIKHLQNSQSIAFVINDRSFSYQELGAYVNTYYSLLKHHPEWELVGLVMHNDIQTYAFMIATFLSDCGYVILNLSHPIERNAIIASDAELKSVISSQSADADKVPDFLKFVGLDRIPLLDSYIQYAECDPNSTAYILFTSGSTGNPKGVKITKKNLNAFLTSLDATPIALREDDSVLQMYDLTFDASILMLLPALCKGATIYTADSSKVKIMDIARILVTYPISYVFLVPSVISLLQNYLSSISVPSMRMLLLGGEPVTKSVLDLIKPSVPNAAFWNFYGPTEATVGVVIGDISNVSDAELYNGIIPIGKPMPGVKHVIVDNGEIVHETGRKGELLVGGDQVTVGYVNDEQKNLASFHFAEYEGELVRFYRTGDLVSLNKYGNYTYCGRIDHQVKIQGYRIELNEIEYQASQAAQTNAVAVIKEKDGNAQLHLFLENYQGPIASITKYLERKLPPFMVPKNIISIERFPVTASDKIDRMKLLELV